MGNHGGLSQEEPAAQAGHEPENQVHMAVGAASSPPNPLNRNGNDDIAATMLSGDKYRGAIPAPQANAQIIK